MRFPLHLTIGASPVWTVQAEISRLDPAPDQGIPENITGKLLNLTTADLLKIRSGTDVKVSFEGRNYAFATGPEKDGAFTLCRGW
jgi:hypothetical protein